jgi:hypothetical protein
VVIIDEASQMPVGDSAIPLSLAKEIGSRVVVAGDHYQLGPILKGAYPQLDPDDETDAPLYGSVMECLMRDESGRTISKERLEEGLRTKTTSRKARSVGVVNILTENFRMVSLCAYGRFFIRANARNLGRAFSKAVGSTLQRQV